MKTHVETKTPEQIEVLADYISKLRVKFGLWMSKFIIKYQIKLTNISFNNYLKYDFKI